MKTETLEAIGAAGSKATILGGSVAVAGKFSAAGAWVAATVKRFDGTAWQNT